MQTSFSSTRWPWATSIPMLLVSKGKLDELNIDKLFQVWESCSIWKLTMFWLQSTSASSQTRSSFLSSRISATWTSSPIVLSLTSNSRSTKISDRKDYPQSQAKDCNDVTFDASTISMLSNRWTSWWEQCTRCSGTQAWWWSSWPSQSSAKSSSLLSWSSPSSSLSPGTRAHQGEDFVAAASWPAQDPGARETGQTLVS